MSQLVENSLSPPRGRTAECRRESYAVEHERPTTLGRHKHFNGVEFGSASVPRLRAFPEVQ